MYIESLELKNFRNYEELSIVLDPGTNILYGDNAQRSFQRLPEFDIFVSQFNYFHFFSLSYRAVLKFTGRIR